MEEMTKADKAFVEKWSVERKTWNWGHNFKKTYLYFVLPVLFMIDLINFFIIGDINYAFISFSHVWHLLISLLGYGILLTFAYNVLYWNNNEMRFKAIVRKHYPKKK